jgi:DNA repair photolyase
MAAESMTSAGSPLSLPLTDKDYPSFQACVPSTQAGRGANETTNIQPTQDLDTIAAEVRELAKKFCQNQRVATKYRKDKEKIIAFLRMIGGIAAPKFDVTALGGEIDADDIPAEPVPVSFTRTAEELGEQAGLTVFEVDKYLRWAAKGLQILECEIPEDKQIRDRVITIDPRAARDLDALLDPNNRVGLWDKPVEVAINGFHYKSLSNFALNVAIGCFFGCLFCYVPSASTLSLGWRLLCFGILDADSEWGTYCLIRRWDEDHFRKSLRRLLAIPASELPPDGHRAIMMCTNTDPYQPVFHPDPAIRAKLQEYLRMVVRRCLEVLLEPEFEAFKVRIQTRGLAAEDDFDLMEQFGDRLLLGMSIPSLDNKLVKIYEPKAPAPTRRVELLARAAKRGIPIYVAMAPTFPECDEADLRETLTAFTTLPVWTIFHETINARAKNVDRIVEEAHRREMTTQAETIRSRETRIPYAIAQMQLVEKIAGELGLGDKLHLWPDPELLSPNVIAAQPDPEGFEVWLRHWHGRISEWPSVSGPRDYDPYPAEDPNDLSAVEKKTLAKAIRVVRGLGRSQYAAGEALRLIVDQKLHRPASFEEFCQRKFGFSRQYGYRLIDFATLTDNLSTGVDKSGLPTGEAQARPIMKAFRGDVEQQQTAWRHASERTGQEAPSPEVVKTVVAEMRGIVAPKPSDGAKTQDTPRSEEHRIYAIVGELETALQGRPDLVDIQPLFDQLKLKLEQLLPKVV